MPIKLVRIIIPMVLFSIGIFYYYVSPENSQWIPKCPWWLVTDTYCPSCGIQRFLHKLLTGHIYEAFCINPFLLVSVPYAIMAIVGKWYNINGVLCKLNKFLYSRAILMAYVILFFSWWIVRIIFNV